MASNRDGVLERRAMQCVVEKDKTSWVITGGAVLGAALYGMVSSLAAGVVGIAIVGYLWQRWVEMGRTVEEIESGNGHKFLPPTERRQVLEEKLGKLKALTTTAVEIPGLPTQQNEPQFNVPTSDEPQQVDQSVIENPFELATVEPEPVLIETQPEPEQPIEGDTSLSQYFDWEEEAPTVDDSTPVLNLSLFDNYPTCLIWGAPGSGKSTTARAIAARRTRLGHQVAVLNPHAVPSEWPYKLFGTGMKYGEIEKAIRVFLTHITVRYQELAKGNKPTPITFVCDEFTNWASRVGDLAGELFLASVSDTRKIKMGVLYISHDRTLSILGNVKGVSALRDAALLELEMEAQVDPVTSEALPTGYGKLKLPGQKPYRVRVPYEMIEAEIAQAPNPPQQKVQPQQTALSEDDRWLAKLRAHKAEHGLPKAETIEAVANCKRGGGKLFQKLSALWDGQA